MAHSRIRLYMRIALVDDHALLREGLAALLDRAHPGLSCLQFASLGALLQSAQRDGPPQLVLLDLGLPDVQGVDALKRLREQLDAVPVLVVSADERRETVLACLEAGAAGYIPKSANFERLLAQLSAALQGCIQLPAELALSSVGPLEPPQFSERQQEVLQLLLMGMSNKGICRAMQMSESTAKTHLAAIFRKLGVNRRAEAMMAAMSLGLKLQLGVGDAGLSLAAEPGGFAALAD